MGLSKTVYLGTTQSQLTASFNLLYLTSFITIPFATPSSRGNQSVKSQTRGPCHNCGTNRPALTGRTAFRCPSTFCDEWLAEDRRWKWLCLCTSNRGAGVSKISDNNNTWWWSQWYFWQANPVCSDPIYGRTQCSGTGRVSSLLAKPLAHAVTYCWLSEPLLRRVTYPKVIESASMSLIQRVTQKVIRLSSELLF